MSNTEQTIKDLINSNDVFLFMKGSPDFPQCGFSGQVAQIFAYLDLKVNSFNILEDEEIRQGIKDFSNWPTIPQLYIKGEFVGGADIIREMFQAGELQTLLSEKGIDFKSEG
ncbi:MAG: Grx4 family monothiol glutaredoxin [Devosiaceae bacterium]|nr:Grx4 family monothiol glutaredoxin [Devosiaceae bacterium]